MMRCLSLWLLRLATDRLTRRIHPRESSHSNHAPLATWTKIKGAQRLASLDARAQAAGLRSRHDARRCARHAAGARSCRSRRERGSRAPRGNRRLVPALHAARGARFPGRRAPRCQRRIAFVRRRAHAARRDRRRACSTRICRARRARAKPGARLGAGALRRHRARAAGHTGARSAQARRRSADRRLAHRQRNHRRLGAGGPAPHRRSPHAPARADRRALWRAIVARLDAILGIRGDPYRRASKRRPISSSGALPKALRGAKISKRQSPASRTNSARCSSATAKARAKSMSACFASTAS